jgi:uncharacterized protein YndB with AHSA1/START domain
MKRMENVARMIDKSTLVWEREFSVKPEKLWDAIATKEGLSHWFMSTPFEIEQGGRFDWEGGTEGTVTEVDPPHRIRFTPDYSDEAYMLFEIEETENGCLFKLTDKMAPDFDMRKFFSAGPNKHEIYQPGGIGTHWTSIMSGYHKFVDALESYITGVDIPFDEDEANRLYRDMLDEWYTVKK